MNDIPRRGQALLRQGDSQEIDLFPAAEEGEEHGKQEEGDLDDQAPKQKPGRDAPDGGGGCDDEGVDSKGPHGLTRCGHNGGDKKQGCGQLYLGPQPMKWTGAMLVEGVDVAPPQRRLLFVCCAVPAQVPYSVEKPGGDHKRDDNSDDAGDAGTDPVVLDALHRVVGKR